MSFYRADKKPILSKVEISQLKEKIDTSLKALDTEILNIKGIASKIRETVDLLYRESRIDCGSAGGEA